MNASPSAEIETALTYLASRRPSAIDDLVACLRIPSVSAQPQHAADVARCAEHLQHVLEGLGCTAEISPTAGHPVVYGEWLGAPGRPTLLIYGHYDVQPPEPLEAWVAPPFEPSVRNNELYARGAADDKGQVYVHLKAIEAYLKTAGRLPVNVKCIIEGEEEIGSPHLETWLEREGPRLAADAVLVSDTPMLKRGVPSICYGARGLCYMEVRVDGLPQDIHSGSFGGAVVNAAGVLVALLARLKDGDGVVQIPGFYRDAQPPTDEERRALGALPFDETAIQAAAGASALCGESGYSPLERMWARPTLDINGLCSGYTGEGAKTIIPASATAKVSMRLVPDQDPGRVAKQFSRFVASLAPPQVRVTTRYHGGGKAYLAPADHPVCLAAAQALEAGFGAPAVFIREGGSIPFVRTIADYLKAPCVLVGFGLPDEQAHAPNEHLDLDNFFRGMDSMIHFYARCAEVMVCHPAARHAQEP